MKFRCFLFISLLCIVSNGAGAWQKYAYNPEAENSFSRALSEFTGKKFEEAADQFNSLRKLRPVHQRTTAAYCMAAKAYFQLKDYKDSYAIAQELLLDFPSSSYTPDAGYIVALNEMMFQKYPEALRTLIVASGHTHNGVLMGQISKMITTVGSPRVSTAEKEKTFTGESGYYTRSFYALLVAEDCAMKGDNPRALDFLRQVVVVDSTDLLARRTAELRARLSASVSLRVGVLLPLSDGPLKSVGTQMLEGMEIALRDYAHRFPHAPPISLEVRDTDVNPYERDAALNSLIGMGDLIALVGPLFSNVAVELAPAAIKGGVPMISPTATANGIAAAGECIFQLHPDLATRGKAMARYAVQNLGFKRVGILSSSDSSARLVANAFAGEIVRLGDTVVVDETYGKDTTDLREPLVGIRRAVIVGDPRLSFAGKTSKEYEKKLLKAGADPNVLAGARRRNEAVEVTKLFGPNGVRIADSLKLPVIPPLEEPTALEIPATELDGLFVSLAGSDELSVVAPQISYFNIKTQLLGSAEWNAPTVLEANKRYVEDAVFISDTYIDKEDSAYAEFEREFLLSKSKAPTKNDVLGYDTMTMIAQLVGEGAVTRPALAAALRSVNAYKGLHTTVTLRGGRVNSSVHILKFHHGEITKVWEADVQ
jgi:ABC-type branched-subunit amino acid transport system substrate-binding protein